MILQREEFNYNFASVLPNISPDLDSDFRYNIVLDVLKILWSHLEIHDQFLSSKWPYWQRLHV